MAYITIEEEREYLEEIQIIHGGGHLLRDLNLDLCVKLHFPTLLFTHHNPDQGSPRSNNGHDRCASY